MKSLKFMLLGVDLLISSTYGPQAQRKSEDTVTEKSSSGAVIEAIMSYRSIRKYKPEAVNRDTMKIILDCDINTPNGQDKQSWMVCVMDSPEFLNGVSEVFKQKNPQATGDPNFKDMFRNASTVVFIGDDTSYDYSQINYGLLGENMVLTTWSMGIGSCCLAGPTCFIADTPEAAEYLKRLEFPKGYKLLCYIAFGCPDEAPATKPRGTTKVKHID